MNSQKVKIRIKLKSFDHCLLEQATSNIVRIVKMTTARVNGAIPLPRKIQRFTFNKSPHGHKKSREQFEIRNHKRLIIISDPTPQTIDALMKMNLAPGVNVEIN